MKLRYNNQDGWSQFAHTLDAWRFELKNLGDLDGRLLKISADRAAPATSTASRVAAQLRVLYFSYPNDHFWKEKADDFARVARRGLCQAEAVGGRGAVHRRLSLPRTGAPGAGH